jgi:hypothetical protein
MTMTGLTRGALRRPAVRIAALIAVAVLGGAVRPEDRWVLPVSAARPATGDRPVRGRPAGLS